MDDVLMQLFTVPNVIFTMGGAVGVVGIIAAAITHIVTSRDRERTVREIAAYVAEGTIEPDKAIAMLYAANPEAEPDKLAKAVRAGCC